jgi:hypothetical protein
MMTLNFENTRSGELLESLVARRDAGKDDSQIVIMELPPLEARALAVAMFITDIARLISCRSPQEVFDHSYELKNNFLALIDVYDPLLMTDKCLPKILDNLLRDIKDMKGKKE